MVDVVDSKYFFEALNAKQELKYILYKYLPYNLKKYSDIETMNFAECINSTNQNEIFNWANRFVYPRILSNSVLEKIETNYFHFIHTEGAHEPYDMDKNLNFVEDGIYMQKVEASLTMIKAYIDRLKDNNVYDNSIIIVMADHGANGQSLDGVTWPERNAKEYWYTASNPLLCIKGFNETHEMIQSDVPVSYIDLQQAFAELIDGKQSFDLFDNVEKNRKRTMLLYNVSLPEHIVEYETYGTAREWDKFVPTGNVYDLN